jgi:hypothetical protein
VRGTFAVQKTWQEYISYCFDIIFNESRNILVSAKRFRGKVNPAMVLHRFKRFCQKPLGTGRYFTCQVRRNAQNGASKRAGDQECVLQAASHAGWPSFGSTRALLMTDLFKSAEIMHGVPE